jgi:hypothetical protein
MTLRLGFLPKCVAPLALLGALLFLAPAAALANNACPAGSQLTCIDNSDGVGSSHGTEVGSTFSLSGSELTQIGWKGGANLGKLMFTTGAMTSGNYSSVATYSSTGSTFVLKGSYNNITNGVIFNGAFTGNISLQFQGCTGAGNTGLCSYDLTATISGTWYPNSGPHGTSVSGATVQLFLQTNGLYKGGSQQISDLGGVTYVNAPLVTAEPASLALMGTGLLGVGFLARRKVRGAQAEH